MTVPAESNQDPVPCSAAPPDFSELLDECIEGALIVMDEDPGRVAEDHRIALALQRLDGLDLAGNQRPFGRRDVLGNARIEMRQRQGFNGAGACRHEAGTGGDVLADGEIGVEHSILPYALSEHK